MFMCGFQNTDTGLSTGSPSLVLLSYVLGADHLTLGGGDDLLLEGIFFLGSLCASFFSLSHHHVRYFFATLSFAAFFPNSLYYLDSLIIVEFSSLIIPVRTQKEFALLIKFIILNSIDQTD